MLRGSGRYSDKDKSLLKYKNCTKMLLKQTSIREPVDLILNLSDPKCSIHNGTH